MDLPDPLDCVFTNQAVSNTAKTNKCSLNIASNKDELVKGIKN